MLIHIHCIYLACIIPLFCSITIILEWRCKERQKRSPTASIWWDFPRNLSHPELFIMITYIGHEWVVSWIRHLQWFHPLFRFKFLEISCDIGWTRLWTLIPMAALHKFLVWEYTAYIQMASTLHLVPCQRSFSLFVKTHTGKTIHFDTEAIETLIHDEEGVPPD